MPHLSGAEHTMHIRGTRRFHYGLRLLGSPFVGNEVAPPTPGENLEMFGGIFA